MTTMMENKVVWIVSAVYSSAGELSDYEIEELDLTDKPMKIVQLIMAKKGAGVFASYEEAKAWVSGEAQCEGCSRGQSDCSKCSSGRLCKKNN